MWIVIRNLRQLIATTICHDNLSRRSTWHDDLSNRPTPLSPNILLTYDRILSECCLLFQSFPQHSNARVSSFGIVTKRRTFKNTRAKIVKQCPKHEPTMGSPRRGKHITWVSAFSDQRRRSFSAPLRGWHTKSRPHRSFIAFCGYFEQDTTAHRLSRCQIPRCAWLRWLCDSWPRWECGPSAFPSKSQRNWFGRTFWTSTLLGSRRRRVLVLLWIPQLKSFQKHSKCIPKSFQHHSKTIQTSSPSHSKFQNHYAQMRWWKTWKQCVKTDYKKEFTHHTQAVIECLFNCLIVYLIVWLFDCSPPFVLRIFSTSHPYLSPPITRLLWKPSSTTLFKGIR